MLADVAQKIAPSAQIVSAFNKTRKIYNYYMVPRGVKLRLPKPKPGTPAFGESLEELLPSLPKASVWVGKGPVARGRVVMKRHDNGPSLGAILAMLLDNAED